MASRKSKNRPARLDEATTDDLESAFLEKLDGYEPKASLGAVEEPRDASDEPTSGDNKARSSRDDVAHSESGGGFHALQQALERATLEDMPESVRDESVTPDAQGTPGASAPTGVHDATRSTESTAAGPRGSTKRQLTHQQMMAEAFEAIDEADATHASKFDGTGFAVEEDVEIVDDLDLHEEAGTSPSSGADEDPDADDLLFFEQMASEDVRTLSSRRIEPYHVLPDTMQWHTAAEIRDLSERDLYEPTLTAEQRQLLRRSRKHTMAVINIRLLRRNEAMEDVRRFVRAAWRRQVPFIRIITGKGRQSEGLPVLKRAVIAWAEGAGASELVRGWAPETDQSGNYGSIVLELRGNSA